MPPKRRRARRAPRRTVRVVRIASAPVGGRRYGTRRRRRRVAGGNVFKKIWSGVKKAGRYIADNKLLSRGLSLIPHPTLRRRLQELLELLAWDLAVGVCGVRA